MTKLKIHHVLYKSTLFLILTFITITDNIKISHDEMLKHFKLTLEMAKLN